MSEAKEHRKPTGEAVNRRGFLFLALGVTAELALAACTSAPERPFNRRELFTDQPAWVYDFAQANPGRVDPTTWNVRLGANSQSTDQVNTNSLQNLEVRDGRLRIRAINEPVEGHDYSSARIDTSKSRTFTYGKLEIDAQLSQGAGTLDAFWMLAEQRDPRVPTDINDPAISGEIDILEHPGKEGDVAHYNIHTYNSLAQKSVGVVRGKRNVPGCSDALHTYGIEWGKDFIAWTVDGQEVGVFNKPKDAGPRDWPFDTPHYLILQLTMGGNFGGPVDNTPGQWETSIAAIRYYPLKATDTPR